MAKRPRCGPEQQRNRPQAYCRRAQGVRRFCYNLAVATHRFHRTNRMRWPSWQDIYKAFNACKKEDYPFTTEVASRVAEGAFMGFGRAHIRRENGRWYLCMKLWKAPEKKPVTDTRGAGAADTGINPHATDSDGQTYENPKAYYAMERKLRRCQRAQARRTKGFRGWWEAQRRIDKCRSRIKGIRHNAIHQMTNRLTKKYKALVIKDLNVAGMMRGRTPKAQADAGMGETRRQLEYKSIWRHTDLTLAPRSFPSSKTCSSCQCHNAKLKRERHWTCTACGARHERNQNAAANLRTLLPPGRGSFPWPHSPAGPEPRPGTSSRGPPLVREG